MRGRNYLEAFAAGQHSIKYYWRRNLTRKILCFFIIMASFLTIARPASAEAFPKQLHNKTVLLIWGEALGFQSAGDYNGSNSFIGEELIYVSSAGRPFVRYRLRGTFVGARTTQFNQKLNGPEGRVTQFEGGKLVSHQDFGGIVRRSVVTFDPNFSNCSLAQTIGKSSSSPTYTGVNGSEYKLLSSSVSSASCSIKDGNGVGG
jgi:hypothetical protein